MARYVERFLLIVVLVLALAVRFYGLGFSLPLTINPDEPNVVDHAVATLKTGDWNPHWFIYPSGYHYLQTAVLGVHLLWGIAQGLYSSPADLPDSSHTITTAPGTYLWARGTTALFGVLTVFLVYLLGRRLASAGAQQRWVGPAAGLAGALLLALSILHVENSRYVATDVPTAALALLAVYLALDVLERGGLGRAFLAGLVVGLAGGFKYNAVIVLFPLLLAVALRAFGRGRGEELPGGLAPGGGSGEVPRRPPGPNKGLVTLLLLALLGVVLGYTVACPYTFADLPTFLDDLGYETHIYRFGGEAGVIRTYEVAGRLLPPWQAYAHAIWEENPLAALAYAGGIVLVLVRRRRAELLLLSFVALYYLFLSSYASIFVRNALPALPGLAVLGGVFLAEGAAWLGDRPPWRRPLARFAPLLLVILLVVILVQPTRAILGTAAYLSIPTSEVQARSWLDAHLAPGDKVVAEMHPLLFARAPYHVTPVEYISNYPVAAFVNLGYGYVVVNSEHYGPEFANKDTFPDYYLRPLSQMERVADFPGHTQKLPGPRLTIFRVPQGELRLQQTLEATAGPGLRLLGFDVGYRQEEGELAYVKGTTTVHAGEVLGLSLYLRAGNALPEDYIVAVRLRNAAGRIVASLEQPPCGGACPPTSWVVGKLVVDREDMPLPPVLEPGTYLLEVRFLRPGAKEALPIAPGGDAEGALLLTEITVLERKP